MEDAVANIEARVDKIKGWLERQLIAAAFVVGGAVVVVMSINGVTDPLPEAVVLVVRQFAVGLVVAALAAVFIPRLLKKDELKDALVKYVKKDVQQAIEELTKRIEDQTSALYKGAASLAAIQKVGITRVYTWRRHADADLASDLETEPSEIRVLGLSLNDMLGNNAALPRSWRRLRQAIGANGANGRPVNVKILLIDPNSLGAALRSQGEGDSGDTSRLRHDVDEALEELRDLAEEHTRAGGASFEFRLYRVAPQLFFCLIDSVAYLQPYYFQRPVKDRGDQPPLPFLRCEGEDLLADLRNHFDLIWEFASASAEEYRRGHAVGTDQGASSAAVVNVFSSPETAARRMKWVIREAVERDFADAAARSDPAAGRLWLQGNSLDSFFRDGQTELYEAVLDVLEQGANVRVLLLHPYCTQAHYRSYREYLLPRRAEPMKFSDYYSSGKHERSKLVKDTTQTIEEIFELRESYDNIAVQLYATAPFCFLLLTDSRAMVEQYHFGKHGRGSARTDSRILGKDMPIVEYKKAPGGPRKWRPDRSPYSLLESHFTFVWENDVADDATEADLDPQSGVARACALELSPLASVPS